MKQDSLLALFKNASVTGIEVHETFVQFKLSNGYEVDIDATYDKWNETTELEVTAYKTERKVVTHFEGV
ncbi:hypothetical protein [Bacillus toyonensis]|uniref:hypothetical protein n=1 Tax=Bacillus toyonensis TaxID=155322 RepID=UPI000BF02FF1|nr:hypothetical protein [Bacillus toyonensis]PEL24348.1 hypothetical protein CN624_18350 [Bacillus toyonensis]